MNQTGLGRSTKFEGRTFIDLDFNFKTYTNKDVKLKNCENAIKQSIKNLLMLNKYEKPFNPKISAGLEGLLFEPIQASTAISLEISIKDILNTYEPRIVVNSVSVIAVEEDNQYDILVNFSIVNTEIETAVEFFLERLR